MQRILIKHLIKNRPIGGQVIIKGWIKSVRKSKAFSFIVVNDGSSQQDFQVIMDEGLPGYEAISNCRTGAAVSLSGIIVESGGKKQGIELQAKSGEVLGESGEDYPLQKKGMGLEFLREVGHFRPRTNVMGAVFRIRDCLAKATHRFFDEKDFYYLNSPIISRFDGEGAGETFHVTTFDLENIPKTKEGRVDYSKDYFGAPTNLCVTGQLEGECFALALGQVYTFGPTFRAENSNTSRHLAEFWMIEPEAAFYDLDDIAKLATDYLKYLIGCALKECPEEIKFLDKLISKGLKDKLEHVVKSDFIKITYTQAVDIIQKSAEKFEFKVEWGAELQTEHERYLTEKHFKMPVIVTDYPKECKAFYMKVNDDDKTVRAMDVLVPGVGEIIGGSQREERLNVLKARMKEHKLKEEDYWWYLDLRKHGGCPHSGFGLGFERAVMYITGMTNIRDVIPFARTPKNCEF